LKPFLFILNETQQHFITKHFQKTFHVSLHSHNPSTHYSHSITDETKINQNLK